MTIYYQIVNDVFLKHFYHILGEVISDSAFYPVETLNNHQVTVDTIQVKNHLMSSVGRSIL